MDTENGNIIHAVLAVYDPKGTYSRHAGVVMASIFSNTKNPVRVHILHDETLTARNRSFLAETAETFGQAVEFHDVSPLVEGLGDAAIRMVRDKWTVGTLFRLFIPDILPFDKVIYLDCDIVVNMDIKALWDISVDNYFCAGALDVPPGRFTPSALHMALMKCDPSTYVNAGVLLMNLSRIREKYQLVPQCAAWLKRYHYCASAADQDFINSLFQGGVKILEPRFNNCNAHRNTGFDKDGSGIANSISHAILSPKPWDGPRGSSVDRLYWKFFLKTPWGKLSPEEFVDLMMDVFQNSPINHRRTSQCYRKVLQRLKKDVLLNDVTLITWLLLKDLYYRVKRVFNR